MALIAFRVRYNSSPRRVRNIEVAARNAADARDMVVSAVGCNFDDIVSVRSVDPNRDDYGNWVGPVAGENGWVA